MGISDLLKKATNGILSEEVLNEIEQAFNKSVEEKARIHTEQALALQDSDYADKLKNLLTVIDKDHTKKLVKVVESIDANHAQKLNTIVNKFKKELNKDASTFKNSLVNNVSTYLEAYLDEAIPTERLNESIKSKKAEVLIEKLKEILGVDNVISNKTVRGAIIDGKRQIDEAKKELTETKKELQALKEHYSYAKAQLVLERKLDSVEGKKKDYLKRIMKGKSADFIIENFDYASNLFDKSKQDRLETIKEQAKENFYSTPVVDRPVVIEEEVNSTEETLTESLESMSPYLRELSKF